MLTPPEEVGGMLWHCPTPSDNIDEMADRQEEVEGDDAKSAKYTPRPATSDGTGLHFQNNSVRREDLAGNVDLIKEKEAGNRITEEDENFSGVYEDDSWGVGEEWLRGAAEVLCKFGFCATFSGMKE